MATTIVTDPTTIELPARDAIVRSYSGKIGCACGCRGNYGETSRSKAIVLGKVEKLLQWSLEDPTAPLEWMACSQFIAVDNRETGRSYTLYLEN
ncbi:hypothetical protein SEA_REDWATTLEHOG_157 [Gordonia phage RedWattleHog]|nr:hypothetical protein SEA_REDWATTLEHOG_157 [Gordonia phage RedWattleHog]